MIVYVLCENYWFKRIVITYNLKYHGSYFDTHTHTHTTSVTNDVVCFFHQYKQMFKNFAGTPNMVVTLTEVETIFYRVADLHLIHYQFVRDLEPIVLNWSSDRQVAEIFKTLVSTVITN